MHLRILDCLACPACAGALEAAPATQVGDDVVEGTLRCARCGARFPIKSGVPRLVPAEAARAQADTADAFSFEWHRFIAPPAVAEEEFVSYFRPVIDPIDLSGLRVLDAGCGTGKFAEQASLHGARDVFAVDLSTAVDVARERCRRLPNVHVIQGDLLRLPLRVPFDLVFSIGVLHHLPDPREGFLRIAARLAPGGRILAWVYAKEGNSLYLSLAEPLRRFTSALPRRACLAASLLLAGVLWTVAPLLYAPMRGKARARMPYEEYFRYWRPLGFHAFWGTVFDKMVAPVATCVARAELEEWFRAAGVERLAVVGRNGNSWIGLARHGS